MESMALDAGEEAPIHETTKLYPSQQGLQLRQRDNRNLPRGLPSLNSRMGIRGLATASSASEEKKKSGID